MRIVGGTIARLHDGLAGAKRNSAEQEGKLVGIGQETFVQFITHLAALGVVKLRSRGAVAQMRAMTQLS